MKAKDKVKQIFAPKKKEGGVVIMIGKPSKMKGKEMEDDDDDKCEKCGKKGCKMKCGGKVKYQEGGKVGSDSTSVKNKKMKEWESMSIDEKSKIIKAKMDSIRNKPLDRALDESIKIKKTVKYQEGGKVTSNKKWDSMSSEEKAKALEKRQSESVKGYMFGSKPSKEDLKEREAINKMGKIRYGLSDMYRKKAESKKSTPKMKKGGKVSKMKKGGKC